MDMISIATHLSNAMAAADAEAAGAAAEAISLAPLGAGLAAGLAVLGAGIGIGKLAAAALEGSARHPEFQGKLQTMMILAIAFVEALALIALMVFPFLLG